MTERRPASKNLCSVRMKRAVSGSRLLEAALALSEIRAWREFDQGEQLRVPHFPGRAFSHLVFEIYGARVFDVRIPNTRSSAVRGSLIRLCTRVCSFGLRLSIGASDLSITRGNERSMMVLGRACDSIAQIALACGFADFGHFSHRYKDAFGTSPREDRARMRSSGCQS